jgi:hypothetical protein
MSKMSEVHAELTQLGYVKAYNIESDIINARVNKLSENAILDIIMNRYDISRNTAIMFIGGALKRRCSNMVLEYEDE